MDDYLWAMQKVEKVSKPQEDLSNLTFAELMEKLDAAIQRLNKELGK